MTISDGSVPRLERTNSKIEKRAQVTRRQFLTFAALNCAVVASGCVMFNRPKPFAPEVSERAVSRTTDQVLKTLREEAKIRDSKTKPIVCFIGVSGVNASSLSDATRNKLEGASEFETLKKERVQGALKEAGVRANDVFMPTQRAKFVDALGEKIDYLVAGYVEEVEGDDDAGKKTVYRLDLIDVKTNKKTNYVADL